MKKLLYLLFILMLFPVNTKAVHEVIDSRCTTTLKVSLREEGQSVTYRLSKVINDNNITYTAYFYNLTDRTPMSLDMTFPSNVRNKNDFLEPHYIKPELHSLGETTLDLEDGTKIKIYNMERTMCDIIRDRNKIDPQIFNNAMKEYFKRNDRNLNLLYKYAKELKIDKILKQYMEVLD